MPSRLSAQVVSAPSVVSTGGAAGNAANLPSTAVTVQSTFTLSGSIADYGTSEVDAINNLVSSSFTPRMPRWMIFVNLQPGSVLVTVTIALGGSDGVRTE